MTTLAKSALGALALAALSANSVDAHGTLTNPMSFALRVDRNKKDNSTQDIAEAGTCGTGACQWVRRAATAALPTSAACRPISCTARFSVIECTRRLTHHSICHLPSDCLFLILYFE